MALQEKQIELMQKVERERVLMEASKVEKA